jgi:alpha-galactosidase
VTETMGGDWGYEYLKIDFIYAGSLRGRRYDPTVTSVQAYRRGLEIIREAAGDLFILGCGAPFAPSIGLVDGMRIGPDVAPYWRDASDLRGSEPGLENAVRSTLAHAWMHPHLWVNDPDCLMLREGDTQLTRPEVQSWTSVVGLSGGMALLSDDMSRLEPQAAALISLALPPLGAAAETLGPYVSGMPTRLQLPVERDWERWLEAGLFNWSDDPQHLTFDPAKWDLPGVERYHLFDLWTGEHTGPVSGPVTWAQPTPAHGVRKLSVHADLGRPQLVGSTLHLLGGAVELAGETWSDDTLSLELACPGVRSGTLAVYVPPEYEYLPGAGPEGVSPAAELRGNLLLVPVELAGRATVSLRFRAVG